MKKFDDRRYWIERHQKNRRNIRAVGFGSQSERANRFTYRMVIEQYERLLDGLDLARGSRVLDAGAGIGIFSRVLRDRGLAVTAADVSADALEAIEGGDIGRVRCSLDALPLADRAFDAVHCFDVLYHLVDDARWEAALRELTRVARRYLMLHERFLRRPQLFSAPLVRMRTYSQTAGALAAAGFVERCSIPTHFVAHRLFTYEHTRFAPESFYRLDRAVLRRVQGSRWAALGSHHIKVFERR